MTITRIYYLSMFILLCFFFSPALAQKKSDIIPFPSSAEGNHGHFVFGNDVIIVGNKPSVDIFNAWLQMTSGYALPLVESATKKQKAIYLTVVNDDSTENYRLTIKKNAIYIQGGRAGVMHGMASLIQLISMSKEHKNRISCITISDAPVFSYRGVHLDVCRHFFPVDFVKRYIDLLALYKMNTFHWHLTDDQGWRIEIKKYPLLTEVGAWRKGSMIGPYRNQQFDSIYYGGFYTQEQIRDVVAYAKARAISVIPEIEMPGHSTAAIAAYPFLTCKDTVVEVAKGWGGFPDVFCSKDSTFTFLQDVLTEVIDLFPSKYIHIGGDECPKERWKECPVCQNTIKTNNLKDEAELQSYFIHRIESFLNSKGKNLIGWDEILEGGLAPNATVMSWRGIDGGIAAATSGHDAIMTPGSYCYFDHYQGEKNLEPLAFGGYTPIEKVYSYQPVPDTLNSEQRKHILGAQANLWTEYITDQKQIEYMLMPRLLALSEVLWSDSLRRDYKNFEERLHSNERLLKDLKVNYAKSFMRPSIEVIKANVMGEVKLNITPKDHQSVSWKWSDASDFKKYKRPISISHSGLIQIRSISDRDTVMLFRKFDMAPSSGCNVKLLTNTKGAYANPTSTLTDGIIGGYPWSGKQWLGWIGKDAVVELDLGGDFSIDSVQVWHLDEPSSWIHAPASVYLQDDSLHSVPVVLGKSAVNCTTVSMPKTASTLKVTMKSIGKNPVGTNGAGENGWLFVSEILVYGHKVTKE
ncbi:MAG TPA: beta-N-acetylhexosaminidase [Bacteroidia bacterium]|nr:beta-N-acetylhexosaminidase [Bacteroidia bacterium]